MSTVSHFTSVHSPTDTRITYKECKGLAKAGYAVTLVAPVQNAAPNLPAGIALQPLAKADSRSKRLLTSSLKMYQRLQSDADIYHFHDPELIPVGLFMRLMGKKVIYDVHENLPHQIMSKYWIPSGLRPLMAQLAGGLEWLAGNMLSGIVAATPAIASRFPNNKTVTVQNYPSVGELGVQEIVPYEKRQNWVGYIGGISAIRGVVELIEAVRYLEPNFQLKLAGSFTPTILEQQVKGMPGWSRVDFLGWQDRNQVGTLLQNLRVGLVTLHPVPNYVESYPVKMFEYMAAGVPVVASDFPLWRSIVNEARCGIVVDPLNPRAIADAINYLVNHPSEAADMGVAGRKAVMERFNWENEEKKLLSMYSQLLEGGT